jgi:hypothetical protein
MKARCEMKFHEIKIEGNSVFFIFRNRKHPGGSGLHSTGFQGGLERRKVRRKNRIQRLP